MHEEPIITMTEFKTVVEGFQSQLRTVSEGVVGLQGDAREVKSGLQKVSEDIRTLRQQVGMLHEGQTEIKNDLKQKVDRDEFAKLEIRVAKLENNAA